MMKLEEIAGQLAEKTWCQYVDIRNARRFTKEEIVDRRQEMYIHTPNEIDYVSAIHDVAEAFPDMKFNKSYYKRTYGTPYVYMNAYNEEVMVVAIVNLPESALEEVAGCELVPREYTSTSYIYSCKVK